MKKVFFFTFALHLFFAVNIFTQSGWVWQNPLPQGNDASDIKMFNSGTGYCRTNYSILKTLNFGTNWQIILHNENTNDIQFLNEQTGYYITNNKIYKTINGGNSWLYLYTFPDISPNQINWLNETTGFVMQSYYYSGTKLYKTTNGGIGWFPILNDTTIIIKAISFPTSTTGYIAGITTVQTLRNARFLKTTNSGINWDSIPILQIRDLQTVYFLDNHSGYLGGNKIFSTGPNMLKTTNGGLSWDSIFINYGAGNQLYFSNFNTGYAGGMILTTNAGLNWTNISPPYTSHLYIYNFSVLNNQNIYVCGSNGSIGFSTNSGANWISNSSGYYFESYSIKFFDANTGLATGQRNISSLNGIILRTTNSGQSWDSLSIDTFKAGRIHLLNQNTGYIAGYGKIFKTVNSGSSYTTHRTYTYTRWDDICFPNENTGYVINKYKVIDKTTNGGNNWFNILPMNGSEYFTICFINAETGFFGGSRIFKTTNGGSNWDTVNINQVEFFCELIRYNNNKLYILGNKYSFAGVILESTDLGNSWSIDSISFERLNDISFPTQNVVYITGRNRIYRSENNSAWVGLNAYTDGGISAKYSLLVNFINRDTGFISTGAGGILKTTNGGGTPIGIIHNTNEIPDIFNLSQNYPNPFNPSTKIQFSLPKRTLVTIKVYNILGQLIKTPLNEFKEAGIYTINFDASYLASGVYFYSIETSSFKQTKKMVLLK